MATLHGGTWHPLNKGLDILTEDPEHVDIDNDTTHSLDATVALGDPEHQNTLKTQYTMIRTD